ncbi:FtsK/SpoIIIE domain-containing protein [Nocardia sp. NPDC051030]|uniref:FtsK/SpoIIIE domain-containing protein n=1 Tax=Nocardia sp. NPDC051030 TaxID=3155162 RepID=UPI003417255C
MTAPTTPRRMPPPAFARPAALPPRRHTWAIEFALCAGATSTFALAAEPLGIASPKAAVGTTALATVSGLIGLVEFRRHTRGKDLDRAIEQLAPFLGVPPSRRLLRATRWTTWGWPGRPTRLVVRLPSAGVMTAPERIEQVTAMLSGQAWGAYELTKLDRRNNRAIFTCIGDDSSETAKQVEEIARAKRYVLAALGPTALITEIECDDNGELTRLKATHEISHKLAPTGYRARLEKVVSAVLPGGRWRAEWNLKKDWVEFKLRHDLGKKVTLTDEAYKHWLPDHTAEIAYDDIEIPYAVDEDGNVMFWRPVVDPHMLLIGGTGSGKTSTVHDLLAYATALQWMTWVVDGKGVEFLGFRDWPNVQVVGSRLEQQIAIIYRAKEEMEKRYRLIEAGASESDFQPIMLILDEFADFKGNLFNWYSLIKNTKAGDPSQPRVLQDVASLARKGRTARIHLVFATQRPDMDFFGGKGMGDMRDNFRMRVSMGPLSPVGAQMLWESAAVGTTIPRGLRGRATTIDEKNNPVETQCFYTPDPRKTPPGHEDYALLEVLRPPKITHERLLVLEPDREEFEEAMADEKTPFSEFNWWMTAPWGWAKDHPDQDPVLLRDERGYDTIEALVGLADFLKPGRIPDNLTPAAPDAPITPDPDRAHRNLASLLTAAGIAPTPPPGDPQRTEPHRPPLPRPLLTLVRGLAEESGEDLDDSPIDEPDGDDDWEGFGAAESVGPMEIAVGDLVYLDDTDEWATVDCEPDEDEFTRDEDELAHDDDEFADLGERMISVSYRTLGGEGLMSVPETSAVLVRRPTDYPA